MTTIEVAAAVASTVLIKGSVVALCAMLIARFCARSASGASMVLGLGLGALGLVLIGPFLPALGSGVVTIEHDAVQELRFGSMALLLVWAVGAVLMLGRFGLDLRAARCLAQSAKRKAQTDPVALLMKRAACAVGATRIPEVRETTELATVALIGFRRPVLLVPVQAREWSEEELFGVLCHELEHARRGDWLMLMLERIVRAIFWLNPFVHMLARRAAVTRECAADDAALRSGAGVEAYAGRLVSVARDLKATPKLVVSVAFADGHGVDNRVRALFDSRDRRRVSGRTFLKMGLAAIPPVLFLAAAVIWTCLPGISITSSCP